jgi:N-acetylglucosamine-6-phosphate deacetylase
MSRFSLRGNILLGRELVPGAVLIEDGIIAEIRHGSEDRPLPQPVIETHMVAPGFVDLQVNGGFGADVGHDPDAIRTLARCLPQTGVVAFLPTMITSPADFYPGVLEAFAQSRETEGAIPLGLHLEGPFLSPLRRGAHRQDLIEAADPSVLDVILEHPHAVHLALVTLAADRPDAVTIIRRLRERRVVVSLGHTDATYEQFEAAVDAGAEMATHLYNAMAPFQHRAPGAIGASLIDDRVTVGLIADGIHSHRASVALAVRAKGYDRVALVTDMAAAAGMPDGEYQLGGRVVALRDGAVRLPDGTLAGSALTMIEAVRNTFRWASAPLGMVLRMAGEIPARILGLEDTFGPLRIGRPAHLILIDRNLGVEGTLVAGEFVYRRAA